MKPSSYEMEDKSEIVLDLLHRFSKARTVERAKLGWSILCPFHEEAAPSCLVFPTGVFRCLGCGRTASPRAGFQKLGVPDDIINRHWGKNAEHDVGKMRPLPTLDEVCEDDADEKEVKETYGVYLREPWPEGWGFRGIESVNMTDPNSPIVQMFQPSMVRLWMKAGSSRTAERFPRLALRMREHEVYLRMSTQQEKRVYNSCGLDQKDSSLPLFGMESWTLREGVRGIILAEGPYDQLRTAQNLLQMGRVWYDAIPVYALLGVGQWDIVLKKMMMHLFPQLQKNDQRLVLGFDNDKAGEALTSRAVRELVEEGMWLSPKRVSVLDYVAKDLGELGFEGFRESITKIFH